MSETVAPIPEAFYVLFTDGHTLSHGNQKLAIRKWSSEPFYGAVTYELKPEYHTPKMNPEGHELAAKIWNERYIEAVKNQAKQADRYAEQMAALCDEFEELRAERDAAILWIRKLANNPRKPSTWMETRDAAANFLANLPQALKDQPHD